LGTIEQGDVWGAGAAGDNDHGAGGADSCETFQPEGVGAALEAVVVEHRFTAPVGAGFPVRNEWRSSQRGIGAMF
jgi:hypothetical protein